MSRRLTALAVASSLSLLGSAPAAAAEPARPSPRILELRWASGPLDAGSPERLVVRAGDPDGVITTVNVLWGDGVFTHADLICFPRGEVVEVEMGHVFQEPGRYRVLVRVVSGPRCFTTEEASPVAAIRAPVRPAP